MWNKEKKLWKYIFGTRYDRKGILGNYVQSSKPKFAKLEGCKQPSKFDINESGHNIVNDLYSDLKLHLSS